MLFFLRGLLLFLFALWTSHFIVPSDLSAIESYKVQFKGYLDEDLEKILQETSQSIALEKSPPPTVTALKRRAESDIPLLSKALQSLAYYDVKIDSHIDFYAEQAVITFSVNPGPKFSLSKFDVKPNELAPYVCLEDIGITLGSPAYPKDILVAEEKLLDNLAGYSYPLAKITDRKVEVDLANHTVHVILTVDKGPKAYFGKTTISGDRQIAMAFFRKKIRWRYGQPFRPCEIESTQFAMEASALFSSISITPAEAVDEDQTLPINIEVVESKHRSVGFGVGYSTLRHIGALVEYEHRNMRHMGERFTFKTTYWKNTGFEGTLFYLIPDWRYQQEDLISILSARREITEGYIGTSLSASVAVEQQVNDRLRFSYGIVGELLRNTKSDNDRNFNLLKLPFSLKWTALDDPLDPKFGYTLYYKFTPTLQILRNRFAYCVNIFIGTLFLPINESGSWVFAMRANFGSIIGATRRTIPPSERFYAGSEQTLRGYRYLTVSPLDREHNPIGGRSMMIYNLEWRWRMSETIGWVLFYDIGNVYDAAWPQFNHTQLQALGIGARYHTCVGPLRLDIAFPLEPRRHVDHRFEIYLSFGHTF